MARRPSAPAYPAAKTVARAGNTPTHAPTRKRGAADPPAPRNARTLPGIGKPAATNTPGGNAEVGAPPTPLRRMLGQMANADIPPPVAVAITPARAVKPGPLSRAPRRATKPHAR